ncbi:MAG: asparagine synthase (glutamine-hydrolyzing) [Bacteroidetes bacterium]|nr:asparagine synthase (glutamine-hydrolyzing) [Bacteroidota bacterium]
MCGIAGFIDDKITDGDKMLSVMLENIAHRGPDARHTFVKNNVYLGHNRLSIIDLSHDADQPMQHEHLTIVYNGEIYNYLELKSELEKSGAHFRTRSDTEVILHAYHQWGKDCVNRFMGMWAFAIWDELNEELFCSRDRFGIKPFYYLHQSGAFYFGSEYKALKPCPLFSNDINTMQVSRGLQMGWTSYYDETYFSKLKALPAAHNLLFNQKSGELKIFRYWNIQTGHYLNLTAEEKKERFFQLFNESVKLHMRSDVAVGSCLSGGLDSSAIVSMVQHQQPKLPYSTFSIYYEGKGDVDERPFVKAVCDKFPSLQPHYFTPSEENIREHFHHALYHADVPATGSSFISQYFLMKLIAENNIKVVLDGQGADEYLAGYNHTAYRMVADLISAFRIGKAISLTGSLAKNQQLSVTKTLAHFGKSILSLLKNEEQLYTLEYHHYFPFLSNESGTPFELGEVDGNCTDNFLYHLMFTTSLPTLLQYEDRNSMAFSVESRVPFLDHRLVEFAFKLRNEDKANGIYTKWVMRQALQEVMPEAIVKRKDKKGFVTPGEVKWLRGALSQLTDADFSKLDFLNNKKIKTLMDEYRKGNNQHAVLIWRLCTLAYWQKNFC